MTKVIFLDRDGVINIKPEEHNYVKNVGEFTFCDGALEAMKIISKEFKYIFIVTNQQGVAKGMLSIEELGRIHEHMLMEIANNGGRVDKIYVCPHMNGTCECRKPKIGMGKQAYADFPEITTYDAVMVGDSDSDMAFARALQITPIRIGGKGYRNLLEFSRYVEGLPK